jgi:ABC-2 type transport system permease protein
VAGGIFLLLTLMGLIVAEVAGRRVGDQNIKIDGEQIRVGALDLGKLTSKIGPEEMRQVAGAVDLSLYTAAGWGLLVLAFVVFFYCLGSLYDDRKDRSVLFWKSLPLSDTQTVLSKVASATVVAPVLAVVAGLVTMIGFLVLASVFVMLHGGNPITLLWGPGSPLLIAATMLAAVPVYALWVLPTVGWLMFCSAWARSKPFLWALMVPVFAGIFVSWFDLMQLFDLETSWFWKNIVARSLLSVMPGSWFDVASLGATDLDGPAAVHNLINLRSIYSVLGTAQLWLGVLAGAALIAASIRLRRWRDEG